MVLLSHFLHLQNEKKSKPKDNRVIPDPIDDRKFHEWKESGKSGILLGITLNPRKCIGEKVIRIPINVETKWNREFLEEDEGNKFLEPTIFSPLKITPEKIAITAPKERTKWKWATT